MTAARLVRGAPLGHRERLQDLRGELRRRGAPCAHPGGRRAHRAGRAARRRRELTDSASCARYAYADAIRSLAHAPGSCRSACQSVVLPSSLTAELRRRRTVARRRSSLLRPHLTMRSVFQPRWRRAASSWWTTRRVPPSSPTRSASASSRPRPTRSSWSRSWSARTGPGAVSSFVTAQREARAFRAFWEESAAPSQRA